MRTSSDILSSECWLQQSRAMSRVFLLLGCFSLSPGICQAQGDAQAQYTPSNKEQGGVRWVMKQYPSLRVGDVLRVDFRARLQADLTTFSPDGNRGEPSVTLPGAG